MKFRIEVEQAGGGWRVTARDARTGEPVVDPATGRPFERALRAVGEGAKLFPQPPVAEADAIPDSPANPHRDLCTTADPEVIAAAYRDILARRPEGVVRFGRYLFATLLGDALWAELRRAGEGRPAELMLAWRKEAGPLNRLPWEMMHGPEGFLAELEDVAVTRRVAEATQALGGITSPRVLFVVGSDWTKDNSVRPGAEYLGLLRYLKPAEKLRLKTHLLLQASPKRIRAAVGWFRPTVVHFICHGTVNAEGESVLRLVKDDGSGAESVTADGLLKLLRPAAGPLPQIVVLNACYTAGDNPTLYMKSGQVASPMAVQLIEGDGRGGVPVVVGMAGQVADQACRLFTRCFYQAILKGGEIAQAASAGRRVGIIDEGLTNPRESVDWAMPTIFMSLGVDEPRLAVTPHEAELDWHARAGDFAPASYPAFCDRLGFFEWFDCLMAESEAGLPTPQPHRGDLQVIAVSRDGRQKKGQLGRTWLLREFAAQAVLDGHLPCLVNNDWNERDQHDYPQSLEDLLLNFRQAMGKTARTFGLDFGPDCLDLLEAVRDGARPHEALPKDVREAYIEDKKDYGGPRVAYAALRLDLLRLLAAARARRPADERARCKLLLLVDDVHQMDNATKHLLGFFGSSHGLRSVSAEGPGAPAARTDVRVICTYDLTLDLGEELTIANWVETAKGVRELPLSVFQSPEDRLAYEFFLSRWKDAEGNDVPLAVGSKAPPEFVQSFFTKLSSKVEGVPSRLKSSYTDDLIDTYLSLPVEVFCRLNDESRLNLIPMFRRGQDE